MRVWRAPFLVITQHRQSAQVFARSVARASNPTCVHPASPWVCVCARACVGLQLVDTADKGWFWGLSLRAYSSSIGGWCVILNNWVTSVQTLSPSMSCLTSVLGALQVCGGTAWLGSALCDRLQWWKAVNISTRTQSVRSSICDLTVASQKHIHLNPYLRFIMAR